MTTTTPTYYTVQIKGQGIEEWKNLGRYTDKASADREVTAQREDGYVARLELEY